VGISELGIEGRPGFLKSRLYFTLLPEEGKGKREKKEREELAVMSVTVVDIRVLRIPLSQLPMAFDCKQERKGKKKRPRVW